MLQLKDIINYLDWSNNVVIYQGDTYINPEVQDNPWEEIFEGDIMNIPWYLLDYYLTNDKNSEAISSNFDRDKDMSYMELFLCEKKEYAEKYEKGEI